MEQSNFDLGLAAFKAQNYAEAFQLLEPIAQSGNAEAQCVIANLFHLGLGMPVNLGEAIRWYHQSAAQGYGVASNNLGSIVLRGYADVPPDPVEAERLFKQAREQGFEHTPVATS
ncbi:MAG: sel1 repeat family protein [Myxacorys californica WJT36-NPBG1]|jgi:TPR repeat protein|nr:sel1 repeat family protein [Myxacorys californica WJT36-NPBG1]